MIEELKEGGLSLETRRRLMQKVFHIADSIHRCANAGIRMIVQPGGSVRDNEVVAACDAHGIAMLTTGIRHFKH